MKEHTKHHYVPQCYLKHFCFEKHALWVYNKKRSKVYSAATDDVCQIKNFYDLEDSVLPADMDKLYVEVDFLADEVESELNNILNMLEDDTDELLASGDPSLFSLHGKDHRYLLAKHIVIQYLRHPEFRSYFSDIFKLMPELYCEIYNRSHPESPIDKNCLTMPNEKIPFSAMHWSAGFGNGEIVDIGAKRLANNYWTLHVSPDGLFHTSDFPVSSELHVAKVNIEHLGLASYGAEVTFPLTNRLLLKIWDRRYFSDKAEQDGLFFMADDDFLRVEQLRQYVHAQQCVFSKNKDFSIAEQLRAHNGKEYFVSHGVGSKLVKSADDLF